jgi:hypothetical protein
MANLMHKIPGHRSVPQHAPGRAHNRAQPPKPLTRASTTFYEQTVTDWWWWELGSWLISFSCFAAIVGLLLHYAGKRQPSHIVGGITFDAFIAVFSAVAKAAMILPVSKAIGQLKWIWFRSERNLADFLTFDNASRGLWGSLILLAPPDTGEYSKSCLVILHLAITFVILTGI